MCIFYMNAFREKYSSRLNSICVFTIFNLLLVLMIMKNYFVYFEFKFNLFLKRSK